MISKAQTPSEYLSQVDSKQIEGIQKLRNVILENLPKGLEETMQYGMLSYVVPHSLYPKGYHCNPKDALPFFSIAAQKNSINLYHMGIYMQPALLDWFVQEYPKYVKTKLDMGKSCIRFKKPELIPYVLIGQLLQKMSVEEWIQLYESKLKAK